MISRRRFVEVLAASALGASRQRALAASYLEFLAIGDWGIAGSPLLQPIARQMSITAKEINSAFVVTTGDNFYPAGVTGTDDPLWQKVFGDVFTSNELRRPWYPVLGNHDWRGNVEAQIAYSGVDTRWRMPARYYVHSQILTGSVSADFFHIDTSPIIKPALLKGAEDSQLQWLDQVLSASTAMWKIVVGHHPVYSGGEHGNTPELIEKLLPLLKAHGVQVYMNGHDHDLQHIVLDGINYITCGAGAQPHVAGQVDGTAYHADKPGFAAVSISPSHFRYRFVGIEGEVLYEAAVPRST